MSKTRISPGLFTLAFAATRWQRATALAMLLCAAKAHASYRLKEIPGQEIKGQDTVASVYAIRLSSDHFETPCSDSATIRALPTEVKIEVKGGDICRYSYVKSVLALDYPSNWKAIARSDTIIFFDGTPLHRFGITKSHAPYLLVPDKSKGERAPMSPFVKVLIFDGILFAMGFALYYALLSGSGAFTP